MQLCLKSYSLNVIIRTINDYYSPKPVEFGFYGSLPLHLIDKEEHDLSKVIPLACGGIQCGWVFVF